MPDQQQTSEFNIVGIGASAGGLQALTAFFEPMPPDPGLAFVVITHQHPGHVSLMPELLGKHTVLPVIEAADGMRVEPNHVYLSPPGARLALIGGLLQDMRDETDATRVRAVLPIDYFLRSLANDVRERAMAVILSGTGSDGSVGAQIVKRESGLVMAEDPESASYDGMPRSVIATGMVDYIDTAPELGRKVVAYARRTMAAHVSGRAAEQPLQEIRTALVLLREHTGHDFSSYKENTIRRRMERRMNLIQVDTLRDYIAYLRENPAELDILFKEFLIGVTNFFRDPEAFVALGEAISQMLQSKREGEAIRVWIPGCSTGEEAYSIAIILRETMERLAREFDVQIFATDLDPSAIDVARVGVYAEGIAVDVGEQRLSRFFVREDSSYRVAKVVRDMVVFAAHNVLSDPPFTKIDLLSCRNLLIYLDNSLQRRLLPLFHYALKPTGLLFLGASESIGSFTELFAPLDKKWKIFARMLAERHPLPRFPLNSSLHANTANGRIEAMAHRHQEPPVGKLVERLLIEQYIPPSVVVNDRGTIVHIHGRTGMFFEPAPGQPTLNLLDMAREGLQPSLAACLRRASATDLEVRLEGVRVRSNEGYILVDINAQRLEQPEQVRGLILFSFRQRPPADPDTTRLAQTLTIGEKDQLQALEQELRHTKDTLQSAIEEYETTNEELKSTNEELQSTNEELQSTNEELETSKEELQSLNEELHTVNSELEEKVNSLSQANDDMANLLNSTEIATVFLDKDLRIKRFTESAVKLIKLIRTDVGRPISDLVSELHYDTLVSDAEQVNRTLLHRQRELLSRDNRWFLMRMVPYRTTDNVIDGLVVTFVDITEQKRANAALERAQQELRRSEDILRIVLASAPIRITVARVDADLRYTWVCNPHPDFDMRAMIGKRDDELADDDGARRLLALERRVLSGGMGEQQEIIFTRSDGPQTLRVYAEPMRRTDGALMGVSTVAVEVVGRENQ